MLKFKPQQTRKLYMIVSFILSLGGLFLLCAFLPEGMEKPDFSQDQVNKFVMDYIRENNIKLMKNPGIVLLPSFLRSPTYVGTEDYILGRDISECGKTCKELVQGGYVDAFLDYGEEITDFSEFYNISTSLFSTRRSFKPEKKEEFREITKRNAIVRDDVKAMIIDFYKRPFIGFSPRSDWIPDALRATTTMEDIRNEDYVVCHRYKPIENGRYHMEVCTIAGLFLNAKITKVVGSNIVLAPFQYLKARLIQEKIHGRGFSYEAQYTMEGEVTWYQLYNWQNEGQM